jgi:hypothetical protein
MENTMIGFKQYIAEGKEGIGLTIWDIDETLFNTKARVYIVKDGEIVKKLANKTYNTYDLQPGESFDFREFKDAAHFRDTSEPIVKAIAKARAIHKNIMRKGSKMVIITARADFDNKEVFLDTFRKQGLDIDNIHVHRAGNIGHGKSAVQKRVVIKKLMAQQKYARVRLFDDDVSNLQMLKDLKSEYPDTDFEAYLAHPDGKMTKY